MNKFEYALPQTVANAFAALDHKNAMIKAGGVDVLDLLKEGLATPERIVNINSIDELKFVKGDAQNGMQIGPNMTLSELEGSADKFTAGYQAIAQAASVIATPQLRNMATLGGNLCQRPRCWYFRNKDVPCLRKGGYTCFALAGENDSHAIFGNQGGCVIVHPSGMATVLSALNAKLTISSGESTREVDMDKFFLTPGQNIRRENSLKDGEIITSISVPGQQKGAVSYYYKQKAKQSFDWPIAEVAVHLVMDGRKCKSAKVVLGSAAPIPWHVPAADAVLQGQTITLEVAEKAAEAAMKDATPLSKNAYKVQVFKTVIKRTICWAVGIDPLA